MLNGIFVFIVLVSILMAALTGRMQDLTSAILNDSRSAVTLALGLVGVMAFFLGLMKVAEDAGLLRIVARAIRPVMRRLFPSVPEDHPAMSAMIMNISSNMLGLGNAATPFGIKAMEELNKLNGTKGTASNAMVLFLAINTAGLALLPTGVIGLRAAAGSADAMGIWIPTWFASGCATVVGVTAAFLLARLPRYRATEPAMVAPDDARADVATRSDLVETAPERGTVSRWRAFAFVAYLLVFVGLLVGDVVTDLGDRLLLDIVTDVASFWILPGLVVTIILFGWSRGVRVYESLVEGAKDGFKVALRIIPFLVAILVAIGMFRASGGTLIGYMVSTFQGSTETTFYVLAVYFGSVEVKKTRHALPACLLADVAGILAALPWSIPATNDTSLAAGGEGAPRSQTEHPQGDRKRALTTRAPFLFLTGGQGPWSKEVGFAGQGPANAAAPNPGAGPDD